MAQAAVRSTRDVLQDHLARRQRGDLEGDLRNNYDENVVCLSLTGVRRGLQGVRDQAAELAEALPDATFTYRELIVADEFGMEVWDGESADAVVREGTDSFVVRDGRIVAQTVHYHVDRRD
jgi:hypothetical protein